MRPLLFEYPEDETTYTADDEFLFGDRMLVAPITRPGTYHRHVYLPAGVWFHYWTGERFDGPAHILAHAPLGQPPIYTKANKTIPTGPNRTHTGEATDPLTLLIYPAEGTAESTLYEDAGNGFGYESGEYARRTVICEVRDGAIAVQISEREGSFIPERQFVHLKLMSVNTRPESVTVSGADVNWDYDEADGAIKVRLPETAEAVMVEVRM